MAKFYGIIGFAETVGKDGIWDEEIKEITYSGDLLKNYARNENANEINDNVNISNEISFIADQYATEHILSMKYIKFLMPKLGGVWKIANVEVLETPRLKLSIGGVYNGKQA